MAVNDIIKESDYNAIRNKLVSVMGTGSADYGWGQDSKILSSAVAVGSKVSMNDWGKLRYDIINAYVHLYGTTPTTVQTAEGDRIRYTGTFTPDTGALDSPVYQYNRWVDTIVANRFLLGSGQSIDTVDVTTVRHYNMSTLGTYWTTSISCEIKIEFASANDARYFFNSGSTIRITSSRATATVNAQNTAWTSLLSSAGTRSFGGNTPGTGTTPANGTNWYRLGNADQAWYTLSSSSPYGSNSYKLYGRCDVANNSTGTAKIGYFVVQFNDGYVDPDVRSGHPDLSHPPGDRVDGSFNVVVDCLYPSGIFVPTGTGNFTITPPTVTFSQTITGS